MRADQGDRGRAHRLEVEWVPDEVCVPRTDGRPEARRLDAIEIALPTSIEARVEVGAAGLEPVHDDPLNEVRVQRVPQTVVVEPRADLRVRDLPQPVHSRVRTSRTMHHDHVVQQRREPLLEGLLHAVEPVLALPPVEPRPVVGDLEAHRPHARDPTGPAAVRRADPGQSSGHGSEGTASRTPRRGRRVQGAVVRSRSPPPCGTLARSRRSNELFEAELTAVLGDGTACEPQPLAGEALRDGVVGERLAGILGSHQGPHARARASVRSIPGQALAAEERAEG